MEFFREIPLSLQFRPKYRVYVSQILTFVDENRDRPIPPQFKQKPQHVDNFRKSRRKIQPERLYNLPHPLARQIGFRRDKSKQIHKNEILVFFGNFEEKTCLSHPSSSAHHDKSPETLLTNQPEFPIEKIHFLLSIIEFHHSSHSLVSEEKFGSVRAKC